MEKVKSVPYFSVPYFGIRLYYVNKLNELNYTLMNEFVLFHLSVLSLFSAAEQRAWLH